VKAIMDEVLTERAPDRRAAARETWFRQRMSFFFPGNEDTVDLCAIRVLHLVLTEDGTRVQGSVTKRVRELIGTATITDEAITIIFLAAAQPVPID
jgi:hypothetical protein